MKPTSSLLGLYAALYCVAPPAFSAETVTGSVATQFKVTEQGAASFAVPIDLPAARGGVQPELSLSYNSNQLSPSVMGIGWSLSGLQQIERCPPTPVHDDRIDAITNTSSDKYCLNGQRLFLVSGRYGAAGSSYRVDQQPGIEISAHGGSLASGPTYFSVHTKAKDTLYFGDANNFSASDESLSMNDEGVATQWLLSSVEDGVGNHIDYHYGVVGNSQARRIDAIHYGGFRPDSLPHYTKVKFNYQNLPYPVSGFSAGSPFKLEQRLQSIRVEIDGQELSQWSFSYDDLHQSTSGIRLTDITECATNSQGVSECKQPTEFEWEAVAPNSELSLQRTLGELGDPDFVKTLDINGDGYTDLAYVNSAGDWFVKTGPYYSGDQFLGTLGAGSVENAKYAHVTDINNDTKQELLVKSANSWHVVSDSGSYSLGISDNIDGSEARVLDVNGDALADLVFIDGLALKAYLNQGNGNFSNAYQLYEFHTPQQNTNIRFSTERQSPTFQASSLIDFNGDGRSDLVVPVSVTTFLCILDGRTIPYISTRMLCADATAGAGIWSKGSENEYHVLTASGDMASPSFIFSMSVPRGEEDYSLKVADINGDGLTDIVYKYNGVWEYRLSNGLSFELPKLVSFINAEDYDVWFVDVNGNGRADVLVPQSNSLWSLKINYRDESGQPIFMHQQYIARDADAAPLVGYFNSDPALDIVTYDDGRWKLFTDPQVKPYNRITRAVSSTGVVTDIDYAPMSDASVYVDVHELADADEELISPLSHQWLVQRVTTDITENHSQSVAYQYEGLLLHTSGLGSLGFRELITEDEQSGVITTTTYHQSPEPSQAVLNGMPLSTEQTLNGQRLSYAENVLNVRSDSQGGRFGYIASSTEKQYRMNSSLVSTLLSTTNTTQQYDNYGNLVSSNVETRDEVSSGMRTLETLNSYSNRRYGRLSRTEVNRKNGNYGEVHQRVSTFAYQSNGLISSTIVAPGHPDYELKTSYIHDRFGQRTKVSKRGVAHPGEAAQTRYSRVYYAAGGRHIKSTENSLGETTTFLYNGVSSANVSGPVYQTTTVSPNGLETIRWLDGFGRTIRQQTPDGVITEIERALCYQCETDAWEVVETSTSGAPSSKVYLDRWSREVTSMTEGFDGDWITQRTSYNSRGLTDSVTEPGSVQETTYSYDTIGRLRRTVAPNGGSTQIIYHSDSTETLNGLLQSSIEYANGFGETIKTLDELGSQVHFNYDASGHLTKSRVSPGYIEGGLSAPSLPQPMSTSQHSSSTSTVDGTIIEYDAWGKKIAMTDPVKGHWTYRYNAFGELVAQTSPHDETQTWRFDELGRTIEMKQPRAGITCYTYGNSANQNSIGRLTTLRHFDSDSASCSTTQSPAYRKELIYGSGGRLKDKRVSIAENQAVFGQLYTESYTYDNQGRLSTTRYPNAGMNSVTVKTNYNDYGYAFKLERVETGQTLKTITATDMRGNATGITYVGNQRATRNYNEMGWLTYTSATSSKGALNSVSVDHDNLGNVTSRLSEFNRAQGTVDVSEQYEYDSLNRLTASDGTIGDGPFSLNFDSNQRFDAYGNITYRSGAGYYTYADTPGRQLLRIEPLKVELIPEDPCTGKNRDNEPCWGDYQSSVANIEAAPTYDFTYDASGNVLSDGQRDFTYNGDDKLTRISKDGNTSTLRYIGETLYYQRDELTENGNSVSYTYHKVGAFERKQRSGGAGPLTEYRYTIGDDIVMVERSNQTSDTYILFKDHIGSLFTMLSANGDVVSQQVFSPFGKKREIYSQPQLSLASMMRPTEQGFTGHRQMDAFGIIHMKGRVYDPTIGRFLQADPHIQAPMNSQSYNRYSYVLNNPLSYTDPSGYFFDKVFRGINKVLGDLAPFVSIAIAIWNPGALLFNSAWAAGAATGFVAGGVATGSLRGALVGAAAGAAFGHIGASDWSDPGKFAASGAVGGISSDLQGGKFGHGFISAGVGAAGGNFGKVPMHQVIGSAVVGGTLSKITGGKFANGAFTAAFAAALRADWNEESSANRGIEGIGKKKESVDSETAKQHALNVKEAVKIVDKLIADEMVPSPTEDGYILDSVIYDPSVIEDINGQLLYGTNVNTNSWINQSKITIYAPGAETLQDAITTYGHELGHFNLDWSEYRAEQYGQAIYRVYKGDSYTGPKP